MGLDAEHCSSENLCELRDINMSLLSHISCLWTTTFLIYCSIFQTVLLHFCLHLNHNELHVFTITIEPFLIHLIDIEMCIHRHKQLQIMLQINLANTKHSLTLDFQSISFSHPQSWPSCLNVMRHEMFTFYQISVVDLKQIMHHFHVSKWENVWERKCIINACPFG